MKQNLTLIFRAISVLLKKGLGNSIAIILLLQNTPKQCGFQAIPGALHTFNTRKDGNRDNCNSPF